MRWLFAYAILTLTLVPASAGVFFFERDARPAAPQRVHGENVRLVSLNVDAVLERRPFTSSNDRDLRNRDRARLDMSLVLLNESVDPRAVTMRFPLGNEGTSADDPSETDATVLVARFGFTVRDNERTYHVRYQPGSRDNRWEAGLLWTVPLEGREKRIIRLHARIPFAPPGWRYPTVSSPVSPLLDDLAADVTNSTGFDLSTLSSWPAPPAKTRVRLRVGRYEPFVRALGWPDLHSPASPIPDTLTYTDHSPAGFVSRDGDLTWSFDGRIPEKGIRVAWVNTLLPRTPDGIPNLIASLLGEDPAREDLDRLREMLLATYGVSPPSDRVREFVEAQAWYSPVKGREESDLPADDRTVLATLDRIRKTARVRGKLTAASLPGPGVNLPTADMAEVAPDLVEMLAIPLPTKGFRNAMHIASDETATIRSFDEMKTRLFFYANADRAHEPPQGARVNLLILADRDACLERVFWTTSCAGDPTVRVWRHWYGVRDTKGRLAAIPAFLPLLRRLHETSPPAHQVELRLSAKRGSNGFRGADALHRWCHALRAAHPGKPIVVRLRAGLDVAYGRFVEILNEARRFGFRLAVVVDGSEIEGEARKVGESGWFHAEGALPAEGPARVPGKALGKEPFVRLNWLQE